MTDIDSALVEAIHAAPEYRAWRPTWSVAEHLAEHVAPFVAAARAEGVTEFLEGHQWRRVVERAKAEALRDAAEAVRHVREHGLPPGVDSHPYAEDFERWLRDRAARVEAATDDG